MSAPSGRRVRPIGVYGLHGSTRRRRIILAEFVVGVLAMVGLGTWVLTNASELGVELLDYGWWARGSITPRWL
jgi:hypothetical protein